VAALDSFGRPATCSVQPPPDVPSAGGVVATAFTYGWVVIGDDLTSSAPRRPGESLTLGVEGARAAWANTVDETMPVWIDAVRQQVPTVRTMRVGEHRIHAFDQTPGQRSGGLRGIVSVRRVHNDTPAEPGNRGRAESAHDDSSPRTAWQSGSQPA
jgi:hypothetical protein